MATQDVERAARFKSTLDLPLRGAFVSINSVSSVA